MSKQLLNHIAIYPVMNVRQPAKKSYIKSVAFLISLLVSLHVTSCDCKKLPKPPNNQSRGLTMEVSPLSLVGEERTIEATFTPADNKKPVDLTQYKVKVSFTETGGKGSSLNYLDGTKSAKVITSELQESLRHFFNSSVLKPHGDPLQVSFTLIPGPAVSAVALQFELLDKKGEVLQTYTVNWKEEPIPSVQLSKLVYDPVSHQVIYNLQNTGKAVAKDLQVRYTNISEDAVGKTVLLGTKATDTITILPIAEGSLRGEQVLLVDYQLATKARFKFEVLFQGRAIATQEQELEITTPPAKLTLVPIGPTLLVGNNKEAKYWIIKAAESGPVDRDQLSLEISQPVGSVARICHQGSPVIKLSGDKLESLGDRYRISLTIDPTTDTVALPTLQLTYAGNPMGDAQTFTWQADLNQVTKELFEAISNNEIERVKELLKKGGVQINSTDEHGNTPLHIAIEKGHKEIIESLLNKGADIYATNRFGNSPFSVAVNERNQEAIKLLLDKGVDINAVDREGTFTFLEKYTAAGSVDAIKLLLANGADINAQYSSALRRAVIMGYQDIIKLLLDNKADINAKDKYGNTPLHDTVAAVDAPEVIKLLLANGADINATDNQGDTLLHIFTKWGHVDYTKLLLDQGAQRDIKNNQGETALDLARKYKGHRETDIKKLFGLPSGV